MNKVELNHYQILWIFVFFDLPTFSKRDRKRAHGFRCDLLKNGFTQYQKSIYIRHCFTRDKKDRIIRQIELFLPPKGKVSMMYITDKQYGEIKNYLQRQKKKQAHYEQFRMF